MFFVVMASPMTTSTPGGTEMGVRPSFDARGTVVENVRGAFSDCHAGTRKPGRLTEAVDDVEIAWPNTFALAEASIAAIGYQLLPTFRRWMRVPVPYKSRSCKATISAADSAHHVYPHCPVPAPQNNRVSHKSMQLIAVEAVSRMVLMQNNIWYNGTLVVIGYAQLLRESYYLSRISKTPDN